MASIAIQLAGTSGSGKSTALKDLYDGSTDIVEVMDPEGRGINASWLRDVGCVVLGHYRVDCGGCDGVTGNGGLIRATEALDQVLSDERMQGLPVFFEGLLMASHPNMHRLHVVTEKHGAPYLIIHCDPPAEVCIQRVYARNNNKPFNEDTLTGRHKSLRNVMPRFKADGVATIVRWQTDCERDEMLDQLLGIVEDFMYGQVKEEY